MMYREYANTGKTVSALGFGGMRFENPHDIDTSAATVVHAHNRGVTYFDTAPGYCDDQSESIMGAAVKEMKKSGKPFLLSSKSMKPDGADLRRQLETSLTRLGVDTLDFYNCWYVLTMEDWQGRKSRGAVAEIMKAKEEGLIKHAVFSTHLSGNEIAQVIEEGWFEGVTLGYSAINFPYREEGIASAAANNLGVVIMNPLGGGIIPQAEERFEFLKVRPGQNIIEGALHFLLSDPRISTFLVGMRNIADVDAAVDAVESWTPYTEEELSSIKNSLTEGLNAICTGCRYCKDCPEDIPVWAFAETANHLLLTENFEPADRLKYYWGVDASLMDKCIQCGRCEAACTQKLPIMERFELVKEALAKA